MLQPECRKVHQATAAEVVKNGESLPPVFPLVLYNGPETWNARQEIAELIVPPSSVLAKYRPSLRYFLVDEGRTPKEKLQGDSPAAHLLRMECSDAPEDLRKAITSFRETYSGRQYLSLRRALTVWIRRVLLGRLIPQEPLPELNDLEEVEAMLAERVTEWTQKWKMEGETKGRMEGRMEGRNAILSRQLTKRFGYNILDIRMQERLRNATPEQLDRWAERILDAKTLEEVFQE